MSENQIRRLCGLTVPVPVKCGCRYFLTGPECVVEFPAPEIDATNKIHRARVRAYLAKQARVILGICPGDGNVWSTIEDINPRLYAAWGR